MTQVTPPGWYPDPGHSGDGPVGERWWDGTAWTDRVRPADRAAEGGPSPLPPEPPEPRPDRTAAHPAAPEPYEVPPEPYAAAPAPYAAPAGPYGAPSGPYGAPAPYPAHPGYPGIPPKPPGGRRLRTGIAVAAVAAVLGAIGVGTYVLVDDGGGGSDRARHQEDRRPGGRDDRGGQPRDEGTAEPEAPGESEAPLIRSGSVPDRVNGISLPIPEGWSGREHGSGALIASDDVYPCPGATSKECTKGGAHSIPALGAEGRSAEEVAKADIGKNAEESYGGESYGGVTSHDVLASKAVTVAGQKGYTVRWKAVTAKGSDGYVESLAFPAPADPGRIVVVRLGVDVSETQQVLDEITNGIKVSSARGGGSGQDV
ncbi:DUF2510 domain-containing protein [Streptomyces sp. SID8352]|uniref:DUF2510 domain-containing protein n=1 Tax=Streptomyces sp. SID8352 TaxID=2690338 RepID=UPI00136F9295|nr:DUF2510 domain-containing protein [Streptomyces sp. SID8352]MYU23962.1 DUF2510 domain-containing protein [Streptomyces sp. SID8352]